MKLLRSYRGTAIVEFAIILPLLLVLLFGIIEFGIILYDKAVITNASREGARAGIVSQDPRVSDSEIKQVVKNYCQSYLVTFGSDAIDDAHIAITPANRDGLPFGSDLTVTVNYRYDFIVLPNFVSAILPVQMQATTVMKLE
jgi:Flp pilus assembly protein TadG